MLTKQQEIHILNLYKKGLKYKQISYETAVKVSTIVSFIRRKHPDSMRRNQYKQEEILQQRAKKIQIDLQCSYSHALAICGAMQERLLNKKRTCAIEKTTFELDFDDLTFPTTCPYLGIPMEYFQENWRADGYPTFDRVDNNLGYTKENTRIVSWRGNRLKSNSTAAELLVLATNLAKLEKCVNTEDGYT